MNPSKSEETIFCEALELPAVERLAFVQTACNGDPALLASIKGLLQLHEDTGEEFLATPAIGLVADRVDEKPGDPIGCYRLEKKIGEGGFGVVWQAQQLEPIQRKVALKIVKLGMDSESIVDRFDDERQTLAMMSHPNIATVLDAGVAPGGRPFFAMELVNGESLDQFCNQHALSINQKLEIFITICRGVQHAHQKGIVHRDLKPSNILLGFSDEQIVPKVIDFGIATVIQAREEHRATESKYPMIGTPQYMSPEQWRNDKDIDTRSDIYSLGVLLYRLLAGAVPELNYQTGEPVFVPPSQFIRDKKGSDLPDSNEDLDWITGKAMSFDRDARYQSVSELAMDLERHLADQAVSAHPGGAAYQVRKFVKRNRVAVGSGVMTLLTMVVAVCASTWGMLHANEQRKIADHQKLVAQQKEKDAIELKEIAEAETRKLRVVANVLKNMLPEADPFRGMKSGFKIREHLDELMNSVDALADEPELEADLRVTAARIYENLSRYGLARFQYARAYEIRKSALGELHPKSMLCRVGAVGCNVELGQLAPAESTIEEVLSHSKDRAPRVHMSALRTLRKIRDEQRRYDEALEIAQQCLEFSKDVYARDIFGKVHVANEYSVAARRMGLMDEAEAVVRDALTILERDHPERRFVIANTKHRLAEILIEVDRLDEAKALTHSFIEMQELTLGENDEYVVRGLTMLADIHLREDDALVAEQFAEDAVQRADKLPPYQIKIRVTANRKLAEVLTQFDLKKAVETWEKTIKLGKLEFGGHTTVAHDLLKLAAVFERLQEIQVAADRTLQAIEILDHRKAKKSRRAQAYQQYAKLLEQLGQEEMAAKYRQDAQALQ